MRPPSRLAGVRRLLTLTVAGLLGLALAVGVTMAASHLTDEDIGLDSEPLTAGRELAPAEARTATTAARERTRTTRTTPARTTSTTPTTTAPRTTPATTVDDDSSGRGRGRGGDGDDDADDD